MKSFNYLRPSTLDEASTQLSSAVEALPLAGGMSLLSSMKLRLNEPSDLVDLQGIEELKNVVVSDDEVRIGAMVRHADVAAHNRIRAAIPALCDLAFGIGDRQVRNRGTLGGSLANNDPAACYPSAALGLDATIVTDRREIAAADFFVDMFMTDLDDGELIKEVCFPIPKAAAYVKFHQQASRFALIGVFLTISKDDVVRVAVTGGGNGVFRARKAEDLLANSKDPSHLEPELVDLDTLSSDIHADREYRRNLILVGIEQAYAKATSE